MWARGGDRARPARHRRRGVQRSSGHHAASAGERDAGADDGALPAAGARRRDPAPGTARGLSDRHRVLHALYRVRACAVPAAGLGADRRDRARRHRVVEHAGAAAPLLAALHRAGAQARGGGASGGDAAVRLDGDRTRVCGGRGECPGGARGRRRARDVDRAAISSVPMADAVSCAARWRSTTPASAA